jgi:hypothetical protein
MAPSGIQISVISNWNSEDGVYAVADYDFQLLIFETGGPGKI